MKDKKRQKCDGCVWGKWSGVSYVCLQPRCIKNLEKIFVRSRYK